MQALTSCTSEGSCGACATGPQSEVLLPRKALHRSHTDHISEAGRKN